MNPQKKERCSNIEFLRIVSTMLIIMGHIYSQSGAFSEIPFHTQIAVSFMGSASRVATNLFLFIGVWFMVDSEFKSIRLVKLYSELVFYSVTITGIMIFACLIRGGYMLYQ